MGSLWGTDFEIEPTQKVAEKVKKKISTKKDLSEEQIIKKKVSSKKVSDEEKLILIREEVNRILGKYKEQTEVIKSYDDFVSYIDFCKENGIVSVDTETNNSLDPFSCKIMGLCLYTPNKKNAYVPINHIDINTNERFGWQVTENQVKEQLDRFSETKLIFHNSKFDCEVLHFTCGCNLTPYWDTQTGSRILDENESARLKDQYRLKIDPNQEKYDIEHLFKGLKYEIIDPELFALYAATDSYMTYRLYEWQKQQFEKQENSRVYGLFRDVEMKVIPVFIDMEISGISIDEEYSKRLSAKYHKKLDELDKKIADELNRLKPTIDAWKNSAEAHQKTRNKSGAVSNKEKIDQLDDPISLTSVTQLAILLYDILKVRVVDKQNPRGTGEEILKELSSEVPLCKLMVEQRGILKLIDAFIDTLPEKRKQIDNKIHCSYNPIGADTGRVSCSEPNLQQIPSKNKEIRMMFVADEGKVFVGADFSQQEPRLLAAYSNDNKMINSYKNDKDLYAVIGQEVYHNNYEDNLEHYPDGSKFEEGTKRRKAMKAVLLGIMYGMGAKSLSERIGVTKEEAQGIIDNFYNGFPNVKNFVKTGEEQAKLNGYVEDLWGRRRRLPNAMLPEWYAESKADSSNFNPLLYVTVTGRNQELEKEFLDKVSKCKWKRDSDEVKKEAERKGVILHNNSTFISRALRQCINSQIQGSASTMTKKAMILIHNDSIMKELGFELLLTVHDELIGQCKEENAEKVAERLSYLMSNCVPELNVPFKCDAEIEKIWYVNSYISSIKGEYGDLRKKYEEEEAFDILCEDHTEYTKDKLKEIIFS